MKQNIIKLISAGTEIAKTRGYATPLVVDDVEEFAKCSVQVLAGIETARSADKIDVGGEIFDVVSIKDAGRWRLLNVKKYLYIETITIYHQKANGRETDWIRTVVDGARWTGAQKVLVGQGLTQNNAYNVKIAAEKIPSNLAVGNGDVVCLGIGPDSVDDAKKLRDVFVITTVRVDSLEKPLPLVELEGDKWR